MGPVVIVGAGAIGTWLAVRASVVPDLEVSLYARPERAQVFRATPPGVETLAGVDDSWAARPLQGAGRLHVTDDATELPDRPRLAIIAVRAYQTAEAAALLSDHAIRPEAVLTLQNGLGNAETLVRFFRADQVVAGTTTHGVTFVPPARARHAGRGDTVLGPWEPGGAPHAAHALRFLEALGIHATSVADPRAAIWRKVAVNTAINPPTAIHRVENGRLLDDGSWEHDLLEAARETTRVARAEGVPLDEEDAAQAARDVAARTARNRSSMLQALLSGRPLETEAITGEVVRRAERHGIPVPVNAAHLAALRALELPSAEAAG